MDTLIAITHHHRGIAIWMEMGIMILAAANRWFRSAELARSHVGLPAVLHQQNSNVFFCSLDLFYIHCVMYCFCEIKFDLIFLRQL